MRYMTIAEKAAFRMYRYFLENHLTTDYIEEHIGEIDASIARILRDGDLVVDLNAEPEWGELV